MISTTRREVLSIIRKSGIKLSNYSASSRVSGWGNSTEGIEVGNVEKFENRYQRNNRYHFWYSRNEFHTIVINYVASSYGSQRDFDRDAFDAARTAAIAQVRALMESNGIAVESRGEELVVKQANPFFGRDMKCSCGSQH